MQGLALNDPHSAFQSSLDAAMPFRWLRGMSGFLRLAGHLVFAALFLQMLLNVRNHREGPALLAPRMEKKPA
jgi:cbb3-type cytochrome oxidase subunit 1